MLECKTVTLRTRPLKNGMLSYYLDYYPGYRDQETMKTIRHEGLNIYIYANPKNERERNFNATMSEKAEAIRCRRFESIVNDRYDFFDRHKLKADFLEYYRRQLRKHDQKWEFVYHHFYNFVHGKCTFEEIDIDLCNKFREYLLNAKQLTQALSAVVAAVLLFRKYPMMRMRRQDLRLHGKLLRQITVLAIPIAVQSAFNNLGNLVAQSAVNLFGEATMAAYTAASRIGTLALMPVETIGSSLSVYASQNHGAGKPQRIRQGVRASLQLSLVVSTVLGVFLLLCGRQMAGLFLAAPEITLFKTLSSTFPRIPRRQLCPEQSQ